jgi:preprotein translocase subunit SecE
VYNAISLVGIQRRRFAYSRNEESKLAEKTNQPNTIARFYRETVGELRKVSWPTREEAINLTVIVILVLAAMAILLGVVDEAGFWLVGQALTGR